MVAFTVGSVDRIDVRRSRAPLTADSLDGGALGTHHSRRGVRGIAAYVTGDRADLLMIRRADRSDGETLLEINRRAAPEAYAHIFAPDRYPFPEASVRDGRLALLRSAQHTFLIAERDGRPVGFCCFSPGSVDELYVVPEDWGNGVADQLHREAVARASERTDAVRLRVLAENQRARRFYERRGWRFDGRQSTAPHPPYPRKLGYTLRVCR
jgi:ribosomal protein S18 acetylase RimI-like enzyme